MHRPDKPSQTVTRAKALRRAMSLPEVLLWRELKLAKSDVRFRKQHPAGPYVLDFFCARANLAVEVDGIAHNMGDRPQRDIERDAWLKQYRIEVVRIAAADVLRDPVAAAESIIGVVKERLVQFGKTPPSGLRPAASPSQVDGEDRSQ